MATPLVDSYVSPVATAPRTNVAQRLYRRMPVFLREPLVHFVVMGGVLFAIDQVVARRTDDPRTIVVGADVDSEAKETFKAARGRDPNAEELEALHRVWLDNEVLYREGLALQVDKGDPAIRERVIFKALSVVDSQVRLPTPDDNMLRAWFEAHRAKYDEPARYDFEEAVLAGDNGEPAVRRFVEVLNGGIPGDAAAGLRVFKGRPQSNLAESYGADFARTFAQTPANVWTALRTRDGWRAMRLIALTPPKPALFEAQRGVVRHDWTDAISSEQRTAAVRALAKKYRVTYETDAPGSSE